MSYFLVKSHKSKKCLDTRGRNKNHQEIEQRDCNLNNKNQQWVFSNGKIKHFHSNKCIDSNKRENGKRFYLYDCKDNNKNQQFVHHETAIYFDRGLCMDNTGKTGNGTKVHMWQCDPKNINQKWDKVFPKSNTEVKVSKPKDVKLSFSDKCKEFPDKLKKELEKIFESLKNTIVNAIKKIGGEINDKFGDIINPIKDEVIKRFKDFTLSLSKVFDGIINLFKPFGIFFASIGGLFFIAPFLSIIFFVTVILYLLGISPYIAFFGLLSIVLILVVLLVNDISKATTYIFKQIFAVFGLIFGRLFSSIIPLDIIKNILYKAFNKISIVMDLSKPINGLVSIMKKLFDAICNSFGDMEKSINSMKGVVDKLLKPIKELIKVLEDIKNGAFGFFEDIGKAVAGHFKDTADYTANQMKDATKDCKQSANIKDPLGSVGSCGEAFGKGLLNSAGKLTEPVGDVAEDVGKGITDTGKKVKKKLKFW